MTESEEEKILTTELSNFAFAESKQDYLDNILERARTGQLSASITSQLIFGAAAFLAKVVDGIAEQKKKSCGGK